MTAAPTRLGRAFFARSVHEVAPQLLGATLLVDGVGGVIVEVEAYDRTDPASHSFRGPTPRNAAMFGPPGHAYVYRSYGIHWCLNVVAGVPGADGVSGPGEAVLIRAIEPVAGLATMVERRGRSRPRELCSGPGRLCAALGVSGAHDGLPFDAAPFALLAPRSAPPGDPSAPTVVACPRIGISVATEQPWRYLLAGSPWVSRPPRRA